MAILGIVGSPIALPSSDCGAKVGSAPSAPIWMTICPLRERETCPPRPYLDILSSMTDWTSVWRAIASSVITARRIAFLTARRLAAGSERGMRGMTTCPFSSFSRTGAVTGAVGRGRLRGVPGTCGAGAGRRVGRRLTGLGRTPITERVRSSLSALSIESRVCEGAVGSILITGIASSR